ncbi:MoaD/ThiS family protein [Candidatus Bathyarchaeota archaeon]|nr:MoaD/ThiS family protein [Candidatus Bathyarchaeota archaeon]
MLKITVQVFGSLIQFLGRRQTLVLDEEATVKSLSKILFADLKKFENSFSEARERGEGELLVLVNGRNIDTLNGLDTRLREGDVVSFISPFAGG